MAQEVVADGIGTTAASVVLGPVVGDSQNFVTDSLIGGAMTAVGSAASKMFLFGQPLPTMTQLADDTLYNGAFLAASAQIGLNDRAFDTLQGLGVTNGTAQSVLVNGLSSVSGNFVREQVLRGMYGPSLLTDPVSTLMSGKAASESGLKLTF